MGILIVDLDLCGVSFGNPHSADNSFNRNDVYTGSHLRRQKPPLPSADLVQVAVELHGFGRAVAGHKVVSSFMPASPAVSQAAMAS
jgi:hypothetical protein